MNNTGIPDSFLAENEKQIFVKKSFNEILVNLYSQIFELLKNRDTILNSKELSYVESFVDRVDLSSLDIKDIVARPDAVIVDRDLKIFELNTTTSIGGTLTFSKILKFYKSDRMTPLEAQSEHLSLISNDKQIVTWRLNKVDEYTDEELEIESILSKKHKVRYNCMKSIKDLNSEMISNISETIFYRTISTSESNECKRDIYNVEKEIPANSIFLPVEISDLLTSKIFFSIISKYIDSSNVVESEWITAEINSEKINKFKKDKNALLIKKELSNQGKDVFVGKELTQEKWNLLIEDAISSEKYIIQRVYESFEEEWIIDSKKVKAKYIVSPYFFGGFSGGNVARIRLDEKLIAVLPGVTNTAVGSINDRVVKNE